MQSAPVFGKLISIISLVVIQSLAGFIQFQWQLQQFFWLGDAVRSKQINKTTPREETEQWTQREQK